MPELPEVETVRRQLAERLQEKTIHKVEMLRFGRETPAGSAFVSAIRGKTIADIQRRAKLLIWKFTDGTALTAHLKMTGKFVFVAEAYQPKKHDRIVFHVEDARLIWSDVRQFGYVRFLDAVELERVVNAYGPEPLDVPAETLAAALVTPMTRNVKVALLDQTKIAGIGNIYADEALHRAGILPTRRLANVTEDERLRLAQEIKSILAESVAQRGTSANDYVDTNGERGGFLSLLRVYGRKGKACTTCGTAIEKILVGQRGTHFCPQCQT